MSLPGPLTYEAKRFGSDREGPAKGPARSYADRLRLSEELVKKAPVRHGTLKDSGLMVAQICLFLGAALPIVWALPEFGAALFGPIEWALGPMGPSASGMLYAGWWGALVVVTVGVAGALVMRVAAWRAEAQSGEVRAFKAALMLVVAGLSAWFLLALVGPGVSGGALGGALVMLTIILALYGAWNIARRDSWMAALVAGIAVFLITSVILGAIATVLVAWAARAFPGQVVARNPWKRTEVAIEPLEPVRGLEPDPEGAVVRVRRPFHQGLFLAKVSLVFGAFGPFVLALPWFGIALFGELALFFWPLSLPALLTAAMLQASFIILWEPSAFAPHVPAAIFTLLWLFVLPALGGLVGARAVGQRKRPWAAVGGALVLIVSGRVVFGLLALFWIGYTWPLFDAKERAPHEAKESPPSAQAH